MERIIVKNLSKKFKIGFRKHQTTLSKILSFFSGKEPKKILWALKKVSFKVNKREVVGIIGKNGSGKTTLLRILAGIYVTDGGEITMNGKTIPLIDLYIGMRPRLNARDNVYLLCSFFGLSRKDIRKRFDSILEFADLEDFVDTKLYQFSKGMIQRLAFSVVIHCNPKILLLDEIFAVGDENFRNKSARKIKQIVKRGGSAILVSHEPWMIRRYCDRVIWIEHGKIIKQGDTNKILREYIKNSKEE